MNLAELITELEIFIGSLILKVLFLKVYCKLYILKLLF